MYNNEQQQDLVAKENTTFTPLKDRYVLDRKKSILKKRYITWDDITLASELILKKCKMLNKISGPYILMTNKIIAEMFVNNQITMEQILAKYSWLQQDIYAQIINIMCHLHELLHGIDQYGIVITAATIASVSEAEKKLIIKKTAWLVIGRYLSENKLVNIKNETLLQIEEALKKIVYMDADHHLPPIKTKAVDFQDTVSCKPVVII